MLLKGVLKNDIMIKSKFGKILPPQVVDPLGILPFDQTVRPHPTIDKSSKRRREEIEKFARGYVHFLDGARIASEVVNGVEGLVEGRRDIQFIRHEDGEAFALIREGKRPLKEGLRIIYAHNDSPALKLKVNPRHWEWDPEYQVLHTGAELRVFGFGGIQPHQWTGRNDLELRGYAVINGRRKEIKLLAYSTDTCAHTDIRRENGDTAAEGFKEESILLSTGHRSWKELTSAAGLKHWADFARSRVLAVTTISTKNMPYFVTGYGHDDRASVYASVRALLDSSPTYSTIVFGFTNEEVGDGGEGGGRGVFADMTINDLLVKGRIAKDKFHLTEAVKLDFFRKALAVNADVSVGATDKEDELSPRHIDRFNVGKMGFGPFLDCSSGLLEGDQPSPRLLDRIYTIFERRKLVFQPIGSPLVADESWRIGTMGYIFDRRGITTLNIGPVVGGLHSPAEIMHKGDLYETSQAYRAILEDF